MYRHLLGCVLLLPLLTSSQGTSDLPTCAVRKPTHVKPTISDLRLTELMLVANLYWWLEQYPIELCSDGRRLYMQKPGLYRWNQLLRLQQVRLC